MTFGRKEAVRFISGVVIGTWAAHFLAGMLLRLAAQVGNADMAARLAAAADHMSAAASAIWPAALVVLSFWLLMRPR